MNSAYVPFQTPNLVWDSSIAIYLFLLGISAGSLMLAVLYKRSRQPEKPSESWIIRSAAVLVPGTVVIGLLLLIFHLARPWTFWFLMFNYQLDSVMSWGVILFQVYMAVVLLWLAIIFKNELACLLDKYLPKLKFLVNLVNVAERFTNAIEISLLFLAVALGAYTGFLLSALVSYPMLNNPVLPALFLASGTSSGIAALLVSILLVGKLSPHSDEVHFVHKFEIPVVIAEIFCFVCFFAGLYFGGGQKLVSMQNALSGFWGNIFWFGVILLGVAIPLFGNLFAGNKLKHSKGFMVVLSVSTLIGVLCLRYFILYAGQMTIA